MISIKKMKDIIVDLRKTHRMQPLGYGKMMEDGFNNLLSMLESEPEPGEFTKEAREYCKSVIEFAHTTKETVSEETKGKITKKLFGLLFKGFNLIDNQQWEIDRLTAENKLLKRIQKEDGETNIKATENYNRICRNLTELQAEYEKLKAKIEYIRKRYPEIDVLEQALKDKP